MIAILYSEGRYAPLVICEHCGQPIVDAELGMVAIAPHNGQKGEYLKVSFLHKGECDDAYEGGDSRPGGWNELSHFLFRVCHNAGLSMEKFAEAAEDVERISGFD